MIMGGSQGAAAINLAVVGALGRLSRFASWLQIIHATGEVTYERVRQAYARTPLQHVVLPFIEDMAGAYAAADLVIGRAGGTSLAEITAVGLPAVLTPLPIATDDHQSANARVLADAGAALIVPQDQLTPDRVASLARSMLLDNARLERMARASRRIGAPAAAAAVVDRIEAILGSRETPVDRSQARREV